MPHRDAEPGDMFETPAGDIEVLAKNDEEIAFQDQDTDELAVFENDLFHSVFED